MLGTDPFILGILLAVVGLSMFFAARSLTRLMTVGTQEAFVSTMPVAVSSEMEAEDDPSQEAVILVLSGGRVQYLNAQARRWFNLDPDAFPSLEYLAHRVRPEEDFLKLCAAPGHARLTLAAKAVEATSYAVPYQGERAMLIALRPLQLLEEGQETLPVPSLHSLSVFVELSQRIGTQTNLDDAVQAVVEAIARLLPSDLMEVTLWNASHDALIPYRYVAGPDGPVQVAAGEQEYRPDEGFTGYLLTHREPLLVDDVDVDSPAVPLIDRRRYPIRSYLGAPLIVGDEVIGTLEVASLAPYAYTQGDKEFLNLVASQVAVALQNAQRFTETQHRLQELRGLAEIARSVGGVKDPGQLIGRILESIHPLINGRIIGFLLYDEVHRILAAQKPFLGLPDAFVEAYRTRVGVGTEAEALLQSEEPIVSENAPEDERLKALGLADLCRTAGIRATVLYPLSAGARTLGFLQVANKPDNTPFNEEDLQVITLLASQVAPLLENAVLFQEARQRAQRAEALRRVASLTASQATLDEVFKFSLLELAHLVQADVAAVLLLDEERGGLFPHEPSLYGISPDQARRIGSISAQAPDFHLTATRSGRPFLSDDVQNDPRVVASYRDLLKAVPHIRSAIVVPLQARGRGAGEIILAHSKPGQFDRNDLQLALATAAQMAVVLERERLLAQSDQTLRQQVEELGAIARLSRELGLIASLERLLQYAHRQMLDLTHARCGVTLLFDADDPTVIRHATGGPCEAALHPLDEVAVNLRTPQAIDDYAESDLAPPHERVRSSLSLPLLYHGKVVGVVHLHHDEPEHFTPALQHFAQLLAQHVAVAVGQAMQTDHLLRENKALNQQLQALQRLQQYLQNHRPLEQADLALQDLVSVLSEAIAFDAVLVARYDPATGLLEPVASVGFQDVPAMPWDALSLLLEDRFFHDGVYFIPAEDRPPLPGNLTLPQPETQTPEDDASASWRSQDLLLVPLRTAEGEPLGLLYLHAPRDAQRPNEAILEVLRIFALHIAWLLQAHEVWQAWQTDRHHLETRAIEAEEAARVAQQDLPRWLHKDLQQTLDRYALAQRAERLQISLEITALLNRQPSHSAVFDTLGRQMAERFGFNYVLVAEPTAFAGGASDQGGLRLLRTFGDVPSTLKLDMLLGQRNPLSEALRREEVVVVPDISREGQWERSPLLQRLGVQGFAAFPIIVEQRVRAVVLVASKAPLTFFSTQDAAIFDLMGRQVGIVLQNLDLLSRTSRRLREVDLLLTFSRQLGVLDAERILKTLMDSTLGVLQHAHAGFVAMWDEQQRVLRPQAAGGYADPSALLAITLPEDSLPAQVMLEGQPRRIAELDFAEAYPLSADDLMRYRQATTERMPVSSMMVPLRAGDRPLGVIVLDNFNTTTAFTADDQTLVASLAQQTALTLENARLLRTAEQRASQLRALAQVSADITVRSLSSEEIEASLLEQLEKVLPYDAGALWLLDGDHLTVRDARGYPNSEELLGVGVDVEDSRLFQEMISSRRPLAVGDMHTDDRFPNADALPNHSWLGVPLIAKNEVLGVIALEKAEPHFFTRDWVETAETFAAQVAAALVNARLYEESLHRAEELDRRTRRLSLVYEVTAALSASLDPQYIVDYTATQLQQALGNVRVSVVLWEDGRATLVAEAPETPEETLPQTLPSAPVLEHLAESLGVFRSDHPLDDSMLAPLTSFLQARGASKVAAVTMSAGQTMFGVLFLLAPEGEELTTDEVELAQTVAKQAAVALQNAKLYETTRRFTEELEARVADRTAELQREHHRAQTLLRIIGELSASLDLDQVLNRTLDLLNESITAEQSSILLARPGEDTLFYRAGRGYTEQPPLGGRPTDISARESLAGWVIQNRQPVLIGDLSQDPRWKEKEHGVPTAHRSVIGVPLVVGQEVLGALMLFHREPYHFGEYHLDLANATAKQVAVAINNAELFRLIREQAERLGQLLRQQEVEASRARAILEGIADGVLVTDTEGTITLFNPSAERILGLPAEQALGRPLDHFIGLFGSAGRQWMDTVHNWSRDPDSYREQTVYEEQIELDDGRVVSVHLAPVFYRRDFLGTVSVFRDITHQVEVDRLKSEFVATVSHELRTPMTAIKGYVDILLMGAAGALNEQQRRFLEVVKNNTERLNLLVNDLLDISRIEAGRVSLAPEALDLRALIEEVLAEQERIAREENRPMTFEADLPPDLPLVYGDPERVRQIVENLVENAYRYTPEGGHVWVRAHVEGDQVQVDVQDSGIGIPPEEQPRVFERFYRGENPLVMASAGTGLGLSIVKTLVEMHGGSIWLTSSGKPGEGSTFSFTLPIYSETLESEAQEAEDSSQGGSNNG
ncbi:MAG: GAF domain-containing protein [Chloroflexi bacterium]|nr:GAF domain-containing protein [Chloroflexota bacterium]